MLCLDIVEPVEYLSIIGNSLFLISLAPSLIKPITALVGKISVFITLYGFVLTSLINKTPFLARVIESISLIRTLLAVFLSVNIDTHSSVLSNKDPDMT